MRQRNIAKSLAVLLCAVALAASASAERDSALALLDGVGDKSDRLELWINSGADRAIGQGEPMELHLRSRADGELDILLLYVASTGEATVVSEVLHRGDWKLAAGEHRVVSLGSASAPYGRDAVVAVATSDGRIELDTQSGDAAAIAAAVRETVSGRDRVATARFDVTIVRQRGGARARYDPVEVADNLDRQRTRGIPQPKIDLDIKFALNSAELTEQARVDLEANAQAIMSARLHGFRFRLEGHTDDLGEDAYNQSLSEARAEAARRYMLECCRVEPVRLQSVGRGESEPLVESTSEEARSENRRVVLRMLR